MQKVMLPILALVLTSGIVAAGCSRNLVPESGGESQSSYRLVIDLLGTENEFQLDIRGQLMSKAETSAADGTVSLSISKDTLVRDRGGKPLQFIRASLDPSVSQAPEGAQIVSAVYVLEPQGSTFEPWLTLSLRYQQEKLPVGAKESELYIAYRDGAKWSVPNYKKVDTEADLVTTQVYHFTSFAILAPKPMVVPQTPVQGARVGNLAPDFKFKDADGRSVSLSSMRGSPVVLNFWATWCQACVIEMPLLQQMYDKYSSKELVVLTINSGESPAKVKEFLERLKLTFPVIIDSGNLNQKYNVVYLPTTFFIDKDGIIRQVKVGAFLGMKEIENAVGKIMP